MSTAKKPIPQHNPESYSPKDKPAILSMAELMQKKQYDIKSLSNDISVLLVELDGFRLFGKVQHDPSQQKVDEFYSLYMDDVISRLNKVVKFNQPRGYFFCGNEFTQLIGTEIFDEPSEYIDDFVIMQVPPAKYALFYHSAYSPENEAYIIQNTWRATDEWLQSQDEYEWSSNKEVPFFEDCKPDEGYLLFKPIQLR